MPALTRRHAGFVAVFTVFGATAFAGGCSSSTGSSATKDGGASTRESGASCPANARQCVSSTLARLCPSDGSGWLAESCATGETCTAGVCAADGGVTCTVNAQQCVSTKITEVCNSAGNGWTVVPCNANETCNGGVCGAEAGAVGCPPNTQQCVDSMLARVCPSDGSGWLAVSCQAGQSCTHGTCAFTADAPCTPGAGACLTKTTGLQCNAAGTAYASINCPANTTCEGLGSCYGAVRVGSSGCVNATTLATSTDGFSYTNTACASGQYCVATGVDSAACATGNCTPNLAEPSCSAVCGNRVNAGADQTTFISTCTATPSGYQWVATECASPTTCNPTGGACGGSAIPNAPLCTSACSPGATRCAADGSGLQTCGAAGAWGAAVVCDPSKGYVCQNVAGPGGSAGYCGDLVCFQPGSEGTCIAGDFLLACTSAYVLEPLEDAAACPVTTTCTTPAVAGSPSIAGAYQPGACEAVCVPGSSQCVGNGVETCTAAGVWSAVAACTAPSTCQSYQSAGGGAAALCGACAPGTHVCTTSDGGPGTADIETCSANGSWGPPNACQVGSCKSTGTGDFACLADCVPGAPICGGTGGRARRVQPDRHAADRLCPLFDRGTELPHRRERKAHRLHHVPRAEPRPRARHRVHHERRQRSRRHGSRHVRSQ